MNAITDFLSTKYIPVISIEQQFVFHYTKNKDRDASQTMATTSSHPFQKYSPTFYPTAGVLTRSTLLDKTQS